MSIETSRGPVVRQQVYLFQGFSLDVNARKLIAADGSPLTLSSRAFDTLRILVEHQGETLSKDFLLQAVWPGVIVEENNLNQAISSLRRVLSDSKQEPHFIQTVSGRGYCFIAPVKVYDPSDSSPPVTTPIPAANVATSRNDERPLSVEPAASTTSRSGLPAWCNWPMLLGATVVLLLAILLISFPASNKVTLVPDPKTTATETLPNSVAVLPFEDLNPPTDDGLFALGLHDELINQLAKVKSLQVISRENVMAMGEPDMSLQEIGHLLQVESVLTGSIMYLDSRARVSLQMMDPATGVTLWASTYEAGLENMTQLLSLQADIAINVAQALQAEINQQEHQAISALPTDSFEAYRYYLAAKNAYYAQEFNKTWTLAQQAIERDPEYIDALYLFSYTNTVMTAVPMEGMSRHDHFLLALESAEKIIDLAPESSTGYILRASALGTTGDWEAIRKEVDRLQESGVPLSELKFYGLTLLSLADFKGAIEVLEANLLTEPVNLYGRGFLMAAYELTGQRDKARREYKVGEELNPVWWGDTVNLFLDLGRHETLESVEDLPISPRLKDLLHNLDDRERVMAELQAFRGQDRDLSAESVYYSAIAAYVGEHDLAIEFMREALDGVWLSFYWLWLPAFDETRQTAAFRGLLQESGLIDYWRNHGWPEVCQPQGSSFQCNWQAKANW